MKRFIVYIICKIVDGILRWADFWGIPKVYCK
jgi:hypothetical protein